MRTWVAFATMAAIAGLASGHEHEFVPAGPFERANPGLGGATPARAVPAYGTSSRIAVVDGGALVIDADSGWLIRADAAGAALAHVAIGTDAGTLAYDPIAHRAYVADRDGDRVVVVDVGATLTVRASWKTPAEPYGVALTPDRTIALVTAIADRTLVAYDVATGRERWRVALDAEPRGVAIAADGAHAAVTSLAVGGIDVIELATHRLTREPYAGAGIDAGAGARTSARGAFAATYLGDRVVATALEIEQPSVPQVEIPDHYGGGVDPPIRHAIAFVATGGAAITATTDVNEPRAIAWDSAHDALYVVGMATDTIVQVVRASQVDPDAGETGSLGTRCGADGVAVAPDGAVLVWCSFPRAIVRVIPGARSLESTIGPELAASSLDAVRHQGLVLFHTASPEISAFSALSCGNCHLDGRSDGASWLIHGDQLQTPMLAGRIAGTAPYKWDGGAKDLPTSLRATITRLGGTGLSDKQTTRLAAYLESMPAVRTPTRDPAAVARGKALFESAEVGCTQCHDGPAYTDRERHALGTSRRAFDTPSLIGLAASAPYFHDGSAPTLEALLHDRGGVHGMAAQGTAALPAAQIADLIAFLESR